jgi:hypothetical protein
VVQGQVKLLVTLDLNLAGLQLEHEVLVVPVQVAVWQV